MNGFRMSSFGSSNFASAQAIRNRAPARLLGQPTTQAIFSWREASRTNGWSSRRAARSNARSSISEQGEVGIGAFGEFARVVVRPQHFGALALGGVIGARPAHGLVPTRAGIEFVHQFALVVGDSHLAFGSIERRGQLAMVRVGHLVTVSFRVAARFVNI